MTKEFLSKNGVDFVPRDIENHPGAREELEAIGFRSVPVTAVANKGVLGFNPARLMELVGMAKAGGPGAADVAAVQKLPVLLEGALRALRQIPDERLDFASPDRNRDLREFTWHIFSNAEVVLDGIDAGFFTTDAVMNKYKEHPEEYQTVAQIAAYGEGVLERVRKWLQGVSQAYLDQPLETYYGRTTIGGHMPLCLGHTGHHLRQLYANMRSIGIEPKNPLGESDFAGIMMPSQLW
ncbi:MAG: DinB family protein [Chloroflexi bacterium]|nr:DinB family protein [Chloroflexota bacterium]